MDNIVVGLFQSAQPDKVKRQIFRKMRLSAANSFAKLPHDRQKNLLNTCVRYILLGSDFDHQESLLWLNILLSDCQIESYNIFTDNFFGNIVLGKYYSNFSQNEMDDASQIPVSISRRITLIDFLMNICKQKKVRTIQIFIQIHTKTEAIRLLYECNNHKEFAMLCSFLLKHKDCLPSNSRYFALCSVSIHAMSDFFPVNNENEKMENYVSDITKISILIGTIWNKEQATLLPSLREIFTIISSDKIPSNALGCLVEHIPSTIINDVIGQIVNDPTISNKQITTALQQMIAWVGWPNATQAYKLVLAFFKHLENMSRFSLLIDVTLDTIKQVFKCIKLPITRISAFPVLIHMLLGFQSSAEAFHIIVPYIPSVFTDIKNENNPKNDTYLKQLSNICQCMMYLHSGFPELYSPILECIKDFPKATKREIKSVLNINPWISKHFYRVDHLLARSSVTNKAGLVNLGNTCYINSVIQALFMIDEFRCSVLKCNPASSSLMSSLYETFSYLLLTKRIAYEPQKLVERSRPSWFVAGTQQDCSEYLKHLLDCLNEEEKDCLRIKKPSSSRVSNLGTVIDQKESGISAISQQEKKLRKLRFFHEMTATCGSSPQQMATVPETSIVEELFHGKIRSCIICASCDFTSCREEAFVDFALPLNKAEEREGRERQKPEQKVRVEDLQHVQAAISQESRAFFDDKDVDEERRPVQVAEVDDEDEDTIRRSHKLIDLLQDALTEEILTGDNRYHCQQCGSLRDAVRTTSFASLPKYFIISLLRFTYDLREQRRSKILDNVEIAQEIELPLQNGDALVPVAYTLQAVVFHSGMSAESGHYYCYAKLKEGEQNSWCLFNDSHVSLATFQNLSHLTEQFSRDTAYVLFFARSDVASSPLDGSELIEMSLRQIIENDNLSFDKEVEAMKKSNEEAKPANVLGWSNDDNQQPPSGGGGDGMTGPSLVC